MKSVDKVKVIISDCHLSAGKVFEGHLNPYEDFHYDDEMVALFEHFSSGEYGEGPSGPRNVELVIAGDYFDYLNVPYEGEFEEAVTEDISLYKTEAIIAGHPKVMAALKRFASKPGKSITYLIGNHDADLFFEKVRERITREWDPRGEYPSEKVRLIADTDRLSFEGGVEIHHGNQFEAGAVLNFQQPLLKDFLDKPVLNIPWGSFFVLKIINRLKSEREYIDKIRPAKVFILIGMILDPWFTVKFCFLSVFYFLKTRFIWSPRRKSSFKITLEILRQEAKVFQDLEREARQVLERNPGLQTVIFGHTHYPMNRIYGDGRQYINTGTWTRMVNLDWRGLGRQFRRTFALVHISEGKAHCELRHWVGESSPHQSYEG